MESVHQLLRRHAGRRHPKQVDRRHNIQHGQKSSCQRPAAPSCATRTTSFTTTSQTWTLRANISTGTLPFSSALNTFRLAALRYGMQHRILYSTR
eukprot:3049969-Prymnesium_polylepis.1